MLLDCGISRNRLVAWLDDELALSCEDGAWVFTCGESACRVTLSPLENRSVGVVSIERTALSVEGDDSAIEEFMRIFTLRFVSAGG